MSFDDAMKWRTESLDLIIMDLLSKKQGTLKDDELLEMLRAMLREISTTELNKILMSLELRGKINVAMLKKGRVITLLKPKHGGPA
ncbi:MAG: hypothetical protein NO516_06845 [Candidatus Methanomethylicia archaeon]|uniref:ArsR family transcriptional regulator n=1 Tax=Candidatus Methanomethylicus mesodigestus TaxID=1867258 RepID=A0A7C3ERE0_9CREN|nr:hypothetical protein [Candidatus Methanomethylicia archaeon]